MDTDTETRTRIEEDALTLQGIVSSLDALDLTWASTRPLIGARQRGYFTPDEDDLARQLLLTFRNHRIGLWDIITRCLHYREIPDRVEKLLRFTLGYAAGLLLYRRSLQFVAAYEHEPVLRAKFNEPEPKFDLAPGFFDEVLRNYTSLGNFFLLRRGHFFWRLHRREIHGLDAALQPTWSLLLQGIRQNRRHVRRLFARVLRLRLRHDWRFFLRSLFRPVADRAWRIQEAVGGAFGQVHLSHSYQPSIAARLLDELRPLLRAGDIMLVRGDGRLTAALLPGFWTHAAIYLGSRADLTALELHRDAPVILHWDRLQKDGGGFGTVLEGVAPKSTLNPLERCLEADHVLVLRPAFSDADRRAAIAEAFRFLDRPYDFEFDFMSSHRVVCTELVYRSFHGRGGLTFPLVKRLGRFTLSGDDIVERALGALKGPPAPLHIVHGALKIGNGPTRLLSPTELLPKVRAIRKGWRPSRPR